MSEEAVDAIPGDCELGVVVVVGMDADGVGEGGESYRGFQRRTNDGGGVRAVGEQTRGLQVGSNDFAGAGDGAAEREAQAVEHRFLASSITSPGIAA